MGIQRIFLFCEFFLIFILKSFFFNYFQFYFKIVEFEKNFSNTFNSFCFCFFFKMLKTLKKNTTTKKKKKEKTTTKMKKNFKKFKNFRKIKKTKTK